MLFPEFRDFVESSEQWIIVKLVVFYDRETFVCQPSGSLVAGKAPPSF